MALRILEVKVPRAHVDQVHSMCGEVPHVDLWMPSTEVLVVANVTCLNLAAVATFLLQKVRPRTWWEAKRAHRATRLAVSTWIVMLVVLLLLIVLRQQRFV